MGADGLARRGKVAAHLVHQLPVKRIRALDALARPGNADRS
jgi:hypothetical protein